MRSGVTDKLFGEGSKTIIRVMHCEVNWGYFATPRPRRPGRSAVLDLAELRVDEVD